VAAHGEKLPFIGGLQVGVSNHAIAARRDMLTAI
jgi:hypothetical protein